MLGQHQQLVDTKMRLKTDQLILVNGQASLIQVVGITIHLEVQLIKSNGAKPQMKHMQIKWDMQREILSCHICT